MNLILTDERQLILLVLLDSISEAKLRKICIDFRILYEESDDLHKLRTRVEEYWDALFQEIARVDKENFPQMEVVRPRLILQRGKDFSNATAIIRD